LVDLSWSAGIPAEVAASFTQRALDRAERLRTLEPGAETFLSEVHQVRGSAGTVGLSAISQVAGEIEDGAGDGVALEPLIAKFARVLDETRRELVRLGAIPAA
jgi:HPt (histidine-containing phosphotransfer) domain-containing protein